MTWNGMVLLHFFLWIIIIIIIAYELKEKELKQRGKST